MIVVVDILHRECERSLNKRRVGAQAPSPLSCCGSIASLAFLPSRRWWLCVRPHRSRARLCCLPLLCVGIALFRSYAHKHRLARPRQGAAARASGPVLVRPWPRGDVRRGCASDQRSRRGKSFVHSRRPSRGAGQLGADRSSPRDSRLARCWVAGGLRSTRRVLTRLSFNAHR